MLVDEILLLHVELVDSDLPILSLSQPHHLLLASMTELLVHTLDDGVEVLSLVL